MDIPALVRQLLSLHGDKQEDLADKLDITQPTLSRWLSGADPRGKNRDKLLQLARSGGLLNEPRGQNKMAASGRFVAVPIISWVSAGKLADVADINAHDAPRISLSDLGDGDFFGLRVSGTSMDRISPERSVIIVNRAERALQEGKPYVFAIRGEATYKLWRATPPRLEPYSTDPSNTTIYPDRRQQIAVIGRVRRSILDL